MYGIWDKEKNDWVKIIFLSIKERKEMILKFDSQIQAAIYMIDTMLDPTLYYCKEIPLDER